MLCLWDQMLTLNWQLLLLELAVTLCPSSALLLLLVLTAACALLLLVLNPDHKVWGRDYMLLLVLAAQA